MLVEMIRTNMHSPVATQLRVFVVLVVSVITTLLSTFREYGKRMAESILRKNCLERNRRREQSNIHISG